MRLGCRFVARYLALCNVNRNALFTGLTCWRASWKSGRASAAPETNCADQFEPPANPHVTTKLSGAQALG
jgi:hypothetical protein